MNNEKIINQVFRIIKWSAKFYFVLPVILTIAIFVRDIFGQKISFSFSNLEESISNGLLILILFLCVATIFFSAVHLFLIRDKDNFIAEALQARKINEINESLKKIINFSYFESGKSLLAAKTIHQVLQISQRFMIENEVETEKRNNFQSCLQRIIDTLYDNFNFDLLKEQGEIFSIAIYLADYKEQKLKDYCNHKNPFLSNPNEPWGRDWNFYENAHVCLVFHGGTDYVYNNIAEQIKPPPKNSRLHDNFYVSAITIPLYDLENKPRGVFCITSNLKDAFGDYTVMPEYNAPHLLENQLKIIRNECIFSTAKIVENLLNRIHPDTSNNELILELEHAREVIKSRN